MKYEQVLSLLNYVEKSNFQDFEIEFEETYINLSKNKSIVSSKEKIDVCEPVLDDEVQEEITRPMTIMPKDKENLIGCTVNSPIVGTFYESSAPDKPAFVKVGDEIKVGDVLCIVEAMKVMNEVKSKVNGKISKILVENESIVEYNQPLFLLDEN